MPEKETGEIDPANLDLDTSLLGEDLGQDDQGYDLEEDVSISDLFEKEEEGGESEDGNSGELGDGELLEEEEDSPNKGDGDKSYKNMQSMYSKTQAKLQESDTRNKELEDKFASVGGVQQAADFIAFMQRDPEMISLIQKRNGVKQPATIDTSKMGVEEREALKLVEDLVDARMAPELRKLTNLLDERVTPLADRVYQQSMNDISKSLQNKYGPIFNAQSNTMAELAKDLPTNVVNKISEEDVETLFIKSLLRDGKLEEFTKSNYQKKLSFKKSKSTGSLPSTNGGNGMPRFKKPKNIMEAAKIAAAKLKIRDSMKG